MQHSFLRALFSLLVLGTLFYLGLTFFQNQNTRDYSYGEIRALLEQEAVDSLTVGENTLRLNLKEPRNGERSITYALYNFQLFYDDFNDLVVKQWEAGVLRDYDYPTPRQGSFSSLMLLGLGALLFFLLLLLFSARRRGQDPAGRGGRSGGMTHFGKAKTRSLADSGRAVTFADVAGAKEEKAELEEVVAFLRDPETFLSLGARIPKGMLLVGPPGTGKTLLARATAGEAGVQFLSISGSDFVELYVGVGASRVRDLFQEAGKVAPCLVFIDEIDAVGRQRGTGLGGGHDEREQTLNQLLVEMDGFASNEGVIVLAATNRADILDPALLRPGRFDRQVYVGLPDIRGREEILQVHARKKPLAEDVSLRQIAQATSGFTGADLENLLNEAALLAAREKARFICQKDIEQAMLKVLAGPEKRSRVIPEHARTLTAYHEAGHAVVIHSLPTQDPVHHISIIPRGPAGGMTISLPQEDKPYASQTELTDRITACLGGRLAEELVLGDSSTGASGDLRTATDIARSMVTKYGMSPAVGPVALDEGQEVFIGRSMAQGRSYSESVAGQVDSEIRRILEECYARGREILTRQRRQLELCARYLLAQETLTAEEFARVWHEPDALEAELGRADALPADPDPVAP